MTKIINPTKSLFAMAVIMLGTGLISPAYAITLDEARTQGLVGERPNGLVGAVSSNASGEISTLVQSINEARLNSFRQLATKDNAPLEAVRAIAGEKLTGKARQSGWYVMDSSGNWSR